MISEEDLSKMYWETYDDQDEMGFEYLQYKSFTGRTVTQRITNLHEQVKDIRRVNGKHTEIKVFIAPDKIPDHSKFLYDPKKERVVKIA